MTKVTATKRIITVPEMIEVIKEHYNLNDTLLAINLNVSNQTVKAWKEGKKPRKDSYLELTELYEGICGEIHNERIEETTEEVVEEKKPYKISYPKEGAKVWSFDCYLGTLSNGFFNIEDRADRHSYKTGLLFDSYKEINQFLKEQTLIKKIKCWAKEQQGDWQPNWNDENEGKHYMGYHYEDKFIYVVTNKSCDSFLKLPYFKSKEITRACIDEFGDEILEVFC